MATAGARYEITTGNIWSYAHRGDLTGLKAALARGVDVNIQNTVGWTACHAAAAGGRTKALRLLVTKAGADLGVPDNGGNLPVHHAAKNGHAHALELLGELGGDVTKVRLSHAKGKAVRDVVKGFYRKSGSEEEEDVEVVGYARKQARSTAFWGPRRTPISGKIKKKILKDKRKLRKEQQSSNNNETLGGVGDETNNASDDECDDNSQQKGDVVELTSYVTTVQQIKRDRIQKRRQKQGRSHKLIAEKKESRKKDKRDSSEHSPFSVITSDSSDDESDDQRLGSGSGRFSALTLMGDSDSE